MSDIFLLAKLGPKKKGQFSWFKTFGLAKKIFYCCKNWKKWCYKISNCVQNINSQKKTLQNYEFEFLWLRCCDFYYFFEFSPKLSKFVNFRFFVDSEITAFGAKIQIIQNPWLLKIPKYQVSNCWTEFVIF